MLGLGMKSKRDSNRRQSPSRGSRTKKRSKKRRCEMCTEISPPLTKEEWIHVAKSLFIYAVIFIGSWAVVILAGVIVIGLVKFALGMWL